MVGGKDRVVGIGLIGGEICRIEDVDDDDG